MNHNITVIVPVYNAEKYVARCIESILYQTYEDLQIILVDDDSTDASGKICDRYAKLDTRIEVYHIEHGGSVRARKQGLHFAKGEYVGFVDADDYVDKNMYESLLNKMLDSGADLVHTGFWREQDEVTEPFFEFQDGSYDIDSIEKKRQFLIDYVLKVRKGKFISYSLWSKLFKRKLIHKCFEMLPDEQQYGEDTICLCLCILESRRIVLSRQAYYHYVEYKNSISHLGNLRQWEEELKLIYCLINVLQQYDKSFYETIREEINYFSKNKILQIIELQNGILIPRFYLRDTTFLFNKRIVIYGAGRVGLDYYTQLCKYKHINLVAWIDSNWKKCDIDCANVEGTDQLSNYIFDFILIAVLEKRVAEEIKMSLLKAGQPDEKIVWIKPESI